MKKILGLDLGVNSIGWAIVNESENQNEQSSIIDMGVRIVPLSVEEKTNFEKGKAITTNADRRLKRSMRRNLQRYKLRREALIDILKSKGIITSDSVLSEQGNRSTFQTYQLRSKAAAEKVSLEEFARVLLMINKKRGYKSNRKANIQEDGTSIDAMDIAIKMYDNNLTPGQICFDILKSGKMRLPDFYRSDLIREFDLIWERQQKFYPDMLSECLKDEVIGKQSKQTYAILSKAFVWNETEKVWDDESGTSSIVDVTKNIQGIKRTKKGICLKLENYEWRCNALNNKINPEHLLIVLQDINTQINASSGYLGMISDRSRTLYIEHKTVGQYLWNHIQNKKGSLKNIVFYRQDYLDEFETLWETQAKYHKILTPELKHKIRDVIIFYQRHLKSQRGLVGLCELERHDILIEKNGKQLTKTIGRRVIPKSHPLFQDFRIWQNLNNIEVRISGTAKKKKKHATLLDEIVDPLELHGHRKLYIEEMTSLANELAIKEHLTKSEIIKLLFDGRKDLDLNYDKIIGNKTMNNIYKAFSCIIEDYGYEPLNFKLPAGLILEQCNKIFTSLGWNTDILIPFICNDNKGLERQESYKLWHLLYSYEGDNSNTGDQKLIEHLMSNYGLGKSEASIIAHTSFETDYGNLCAKAIGKILPYLKEGNTYDQACIYAAYNHSRQSISSEENVTRPLRHHLENIHKNSLRNPVVEKILNQMVNVVNALIDEYGDNNLSGSFDEIRVELARELKKNAKEREDLSKAIRDNDAENARIREIIKKDFNIQHVSRNDIIRYKLYKELEPNGYKTLYSEKYIPYDMLFSKDIDIEHIIPQACLFDDSLSNKTLEYRAVNIAKGKKTAYDYVRDTYGENAMEAYEKRCQNCFANRKGKLQKLLMTAADIPQGFIDRDLRDTQYISKKALSMLLTICRSVVATTGAITVKLRKDWQLIDIMKELNFPKYEKLGLVNTFRSADGHEERSITNWTKRNDHRHHAMDALTVAFTRRAFIQFFNNRNAQWDKDTAMHDSIIAINKKYFKGGKVVPPMPLPLLRAQAKMFLENILVSLKAKNKVVTVSTNKIKTKKGILEIKQNAPRGSLHKETIYGIRHKYVKRLETVNASFDTEKIKTVCKASFREALLQRLLICGGDPKKAFTGKNALSKNPIYLNMDKTSFVPVKVETVNLEEYYTIRKPIDQSLSVDSVVDVALRHVLKKRLARFNNDPKKAFANIEEDPILLNGNPVKRVTIVAKVDKGMCIHDKRDKNGNFITDESGGYIPTDFVKASENHHAAIFRRPKIDKNGKQMHDANGEIIYEWEEKIVTFYEAVTRKNNSMPIVDKLWGKDNGWQFVFSIKKNEYFIIPDSSFNPENIDLLDMSNASEISKHLFRAQKFSSKDYFFRHHLETNVEDVPALKGITWLRINTLSNFSGMIKVRVDHIGRIVSVNEY